MIIGLCKGAAGLPRDLLGFGYSIYYIEYGFSNALMELVKPEIIIRSSILANTLLFEFKTGESFDLDQFQRYSNVTQEDIEQKALVGSKYLKTFDIVYLCLSENLSVFRESLENKHFRPPLLSYDRATLKLAHNTFKEEKLNVLFRNGLSVKFDEIPTAFVPFHQGSSDWEFAEAIGPKLIECMYRNESRILLTSLCRDLIPEWDNLSDSEQKFFRSKIQTVLDLACRSELKGYIIRSKEQDPRRKGDRVWEITHNPLHIPQPHKKGTAFRKLKTLQNRFIEFLRTGKRETSQQEIEFPS
jgi:hypothetical protein